MNNEPSGYALEVYEAVKVYGTPPGGVRALDRVSIQVLNNEFFTLLGPSGCGKTTLLRMIAGFEEPTSGRISLHGANIESLPAHKRRVNTVFQSYALFPHMTIAQNIAFGLENLRWDKQRIKQRVAAMLALVHMEKFGNRQASQLSGGQKQRVALARALAPEPELLLLDEPLSALDLKLRQAMRNELRALQRQTGITFLFVTHDQEEALDMSDRICVLGDGIIQQIGTPDDIYENPANRFVADFIGDTNFMDVDVKSVDGNQARVVTSTGWKFRPVRSPPKWAVVQPCHYVPKKLVFRNRPRASSCKERSPAEIIWADTRTIRLPLEIPNFAFPKETVSARVPCMAWANQ